MFLINQNPYPLLSLPPRIYRAALETMNIVQVTDIIAATSCLTALSVSVSPLADWKHPLSGQIRPSALNQAIAAISGDRKSSADELVCLPIYEHDAAVVVAQAAEARDFVNAKLRWAAIKKGLLSRISKLACAGQATDELDTQLASHEALEPRKPAACRIIHQDLTRVSAFEALEGDGRAIAVLTDEGQTLLDSTVMRHYGFLNHAWDGKQLLTYDRAEHQSIIVQNPRVTISFMIQPDVLASFFAKRGKVVQSSGFCARYLFSRSPSLQGTRWPKISTPLLDLLPFHGRISELLRTYQGMSKAGAVSRVVLEFDEGAKDLWVRMAADVEGHFQPGNYLHDISDFGNKYMDIIGRIACLLHYFEASASDGSEAPEAQAAAIGKIPMETLDRAATIALWHLHEYKQLFSPVMQRTPEDFDADRLYCYLFRSCHLRNVWETPKNFVRQHCGVRGEGRFDHALRQLVARQAVSVISKTLGKGKKETAVIWLNCRYFMGNPIH